MSVERTKWKLKGHWQLKVCRSTDFRSYSAWENLRVIIIVTLRRKRPLVRPKLSQFLLKNAFLFKNISLCQIFFIKSCVYQKIRHNSQLCRILCFEVDRFIGALKNGYQVGPKRLQFLIKMFFFLNVSFGEFVFCKIVWNVKANKFDKIPKFQVDRSI